MSIYYHFETFGEKSIGSLNIFELEEKLNFQAPYTEGIKFSGYRTEANVVQALYFYLKKSGAEIIVNFIDDNDYEERKLKNKKLPEEQVFNIESESLKKEILDFLISGQKVDGYIINKEKKEYIKCKTFTAFSPLAFLTGNPEVFHNEFEKFEIYQEKDEKADFQKYCGSWTDSYIQWSAEPPAEFKDITAKTSYVF